MSRILIAGCGDVGIGLSLLLHSSGHYVWGLRRNPAFLPQPIQGIEADLTRPDTLRALPPSLDAVVYCAAADQRSTSAYNAAYVEGIDNLIHALQEQGQDALRFLLTSSTSVYTQNDAGWVDEDSPVAPDSDRTLALRSGEKRVLDSPWKSVIVRFGGIYGPGRRALVNRVLGDGATCRTGLYSNRIHRDDCAGVLFHVLSRSDPHLLYLGVDGHPAPICEVMRWLAQRLEVPPPEEIPAPREGPGARSNKRCSNKRLLADGYRFLYPSYREGYAAILADR